MPHRGGVATCTRTSGHPRSEPRSAPLEPEATPTDARLFSLRCGHGHNLHVAEHVIGPPRVGPLGRLRRGLSMLGRVPGTASGLDARQSGTLSRRARVLHLRHVHNGSDVTAPDAGAPSWISSMSSAVRGQDTRPGASRRCQRGHPGSFVRFPCPVAWLTVLARVGPPAPSSGPAALRLGRPGRAR